MRLDDADGPEAVTCMPDIGLGSCQEGAQPHRTSESIAHLSIIQQHILLESFRDAADARDGLVRERSSLIAVLPICGHLHAPVCTGNFIVLLNCF